MLAEKVAVKTTTSKHKKLFNFMLNVRRFQLALMERKIAGWLTRRISNAFRKLPPEEITVTVDGRPLLIRLNDTSHYSIVLGKHEPKTIKWIYDNVGPGYVVIDIGANIGYMTMLFADGVTDTGRVIAVEPDPRSRRMLSRNLRFNGKKNVTTLSLAIHDTCDVVNFGLAVSSAWSGIACDHVETWIKVPAVTVDVLVDRYCWERVDVVKIDVEGTEMAVLRGMNETIKNYHPTILVEFHGTDEEINNHPAKKWLREHGYKFEYLEYWFIVATKN